MSRYTVVDADGNKRSATLDDLRAWHAQGHLHDNTMVTSEETGNQIPLSLLLKMQPFQAPDIPQDSTYELFADKVGFVPNTKKKDNLFQAKVFGSVWVICIVVGAIWGAMTSPKGVEGGIADGLLTGFFLGVVVALVVSGAITGARTTLR
ncbi:MAG: hypothetical protein QM758_03475 [Armatimonas sp.]